MTLDSAGNVVLAVSGAAPGTSPALQVLAESSATYYGVAMTAGDIYTVAGAPSHTVGHAERPDLDPQYREREPVLHRRIGLERQSRRVLGCSDGGLPRPRRLERQPERRTAGWRHQRHGHGYQPGERHRGRLRDATAGTSPPTPPLHHGHLAGRHGNGRRHRHNAWWHLGHLEPDQFTYTAARRSQPSARPPVPAVAAPRHGHGHQPGECHRGRLRECHTPGSPPIRRTPSR